MSPRTRLLLHVPYLGADPLNQPAQLRDLGLGELEVIPMLACRGLQLLDLMREEKHMSMEKSPVQEYPAGGATTSCPTLQSV